MLPPSEVLPKSPMSKRSGSTSSNSSAVLSSAGSEEVDLLLSSASAIEPRCVPSIEKTLPSSSTPAWSRDGFPRRLADGGGLWLPGGGPPRPRPRPRPRKLPIPPRPRGWPRFRAVAFELRTRAASVILRNLRSDGHTLLPAASFLVWPKPRQFQQRGSFATLAPVEPAADNE